MGQVDNDNEEAKNELIFYHDLTLNWAIVYETLGLGDPITYIRS